MIMNLFILLSIIIILFNSLIYAGTYKCPTNQVHVNYARASRMPGATYKERVGLDTINVKLDRDVPCGIYKIKTIYGNGLLFVSNNNYRYGYINMKNINNIINIKLLDIWDLKRLESKENLFIDTYNKGCC